MSRFKWLGGIIPFAVGVVFIIYVIILAIFFRSKRDKRVSPDGMQSVSQTAFQRYFYGGIGFENIYQSPWGHWFMYLLFLWRVACFAFFYGNDTIGGLIRNSGNSAMYFTNWNVYLISLYYALASIASVIGICKDNAFRDHVQQQQHNNNNRNRANHPFWADNTTSLGIIVHILFEIAGSTAFFITVINFSELNSDFIFWNVSLHFATSISFLIELFLNSMFVRWEHVLFTVTWGLIYLIFIWSMVATGAATKWPYFFLDTENVTVLFAALVVFYYVFYGIDALKWAVVGRKPYTYVPLLLSQPQQQQPDAVLSVAAGVDPEPKVNYFV
jgi:hypothetical protein